MGQKISTKIAKKTPDSCSFCRKDTKQLRKCSQCQDVMYCDASCQKSDWPDHKRLCSDAVGVDDSNFGKGLFAKKNFDSHVKIVQKPALIQFVNHACKPNVFYAGRNGLFALRPIAAGEEITWNYVQHAPFQSRETRRAHIMEEIGFDCLCDYCEEEPPEDALLGDIGQYLQAISIHSDIEDAIDDLKQGLALLYETDFADRGGLLKFYRQLCRAYLQKGDKATGLIWAEKYEEIRLGRELSTYAECELLETLLQQGYF